MKFCDLFNLLGLKKMHQPQSFFFFFRKVTQWRWLAPLQTLWISWPIRQELIRGGIKNGFFFWLTLDFVTPQQCPQSELLVRKNQILNSKYFEKYWAFYGAISKYWVLCGAIWCSNAFLISKYWVLHGGISCLYMGK